MRCVNREHNTQVASSLLVRLTLVRKDKPAAEWEERMSRKPTNANIPEAVRWFNRFRMQGAPALSPDESAEWARWSTDKTHLSALRLVEQLWKDLRHLKKTPLPTQQDLDADDYDPELSISEWLERNR
jgi:hypothetical protein